MTLNSLQYSLMSFTVLIALSGTTHAATTYMEARNDAMGGTGVASSHYGTAALANPALLTHFGATDDFSLILPSVGAQVSDPNNLLNGDVWDAAGRYDKELSGGNVSPKTAADLRDQLTKFKNTHASLQASVGVVAAVPNSVVPFALMVKPWGTATVDSKVSDRDLQYLDDVANSTTNAVRDSLTSRAYGRAALVSDVGIAMAREFESSGFKYSVGVTPKYQRVDLFNYNIKVNDNNNSNGYHNTTTGFNADIGFTTDLNDNWTLGLVAQNIVPRSIDTKDVDGLKETFKIRPQATAGASWHNSLVTAALDVDLTPASGFTSDKKHQFASLGAEFDAWKWAQLRAGYRQNMSSSEGSAFTAGIGISPFDVMHLDLTGLVGTDRTYGAVAQLSVTF